MIKLGILGCSNIAFSRFVPAASDMREIKIVSAASVHSPEKLSDLCNQYDIIAESSYEEVLSNKDIDAVYIPLPPALHYIWAKEALKMGKHVLLEKPSSTSFEETEELVCLAKSKGLALHENYMFQYHSQISEIKRMIDGGIIGDIRLYRGDFGFPLRKSNDFRYVRSLGGGALLDAGGYPIKLATILLGDTIKIDSATAGFIKPMFEVDMYGNISMSNQDGVVFQASYGMDNAYRCSFEAWGSKGILKTGRIFTAPPELEPEFEIISSQETKIIKGKRDSHFMRSIEQFCLEIQNESERIDMYKQILMQAKLVDEVKNEFRI